MIFAEWKTRSLLRKNAKKSHFFFAFCAFFRHFCKIEKFLQVQKFFRIFTVAACKYKGDNRQIMGRSWATSRPHRNRVSQKKIRENFFTKKTYIRRHWNRCFNGVVAFATFSAPKGLQETCERYSDSDEYPLKIHNFF